MLEFCKSTCKHAYICMDAHACTHACTHTTNMHTFTCTDTSMLALHFKRFTEDKKFPLYRGIQCQQVICDGRILWLSWSLNHRVTESQSHGGTESQSHRGTESQTHRESQSHRVTESQTHRESQSQSLQHE